MLNLDYSLPLHPEPAVERPRLHPIDWMRGIAMLLMVVDHASTVLNPGRLFLDSTWIGGLGANLAPAGSPWQFLTRWITHLCAPTFVFLAGTSLAMSSAKRRALGIPWRDIDRHVLVRGLIIVALELWMALAFGMVLFQVLFALGAGMMCMVLLRRVPPRLLLAGSLAWIVGGEAVTSALGLSFGGPAPVWVGWLLVPTVQKSLFLGIGGGFAYPLLGWLPLMALGWVYGGFLVTKPARSSRDRVLPLLGFGAVSLATFALQRVWNAYGNFGLARTDDTLLRWLQVNKYPPSLAYVGLELGILFFVLAACFAFAGRRPVRKHNPLLVFGQTALFFYLLHFHLLRLVGLAVTGGYRKPDWGLGATYAAALGALLLLYPACRWYRGFKARHPHGWARYV